MNFFGFFLHIRFELFLSPELFGNRKLISYFVISWTFARHVPHFVLCIFLFPRSLCTDLNVTKFDDRFHRERERDRPRSREPREARESREQREPPGGNYNNYYNDSPAHDYGFRERERDLPAASVARERPIGPPARYPSRNHSSQHNIPPLLPHLAPVSAGPPPLMSLGASQPDRKDYYDSYNRYFRHNSTLICVHIETKKLMQKVEKNCENTNNSAVCHRRNAHRCPGN